MSLEPTIDHFAALGQPRRPWLEPEALREKLREATMAEHPDRGGDPRAFAAVNAAFAVLREPGSRVRHFLELEFPVALRELSSAPPVALADRFMAIAQWRSRAAALEGRLAAASSPLERALLAEERVTVAEGVNGALAALEDLRERTLAALRSEDAEWEGRGPEAAGRLAAIVQELAFLDRWMGQLREALVRLDIGAGG